MIVCGGLNLTHEAFRNGKSLKNVKMSVTVEDYLTFLIINKLGSNKQEKLSEKLVWPYKLRKSIFLDVTFYEAFLLVIFLLNEAVGSFSDQWTSLLLLIGQYDALAGHIYLVRKEIWMFRNDIQYWEQNSFSNYF